MEDGSRIDSSQFRSLNDSGLLPRTNQKSNAGGSGSTADLLGKKMNLRSKFIKNNGLRQSGIMIAGGISGSPTFNRNTSLG